MLTKEANAGRCNLPLDRVILKTPRKSPRIRCGSGEDGVAPLPPTAPTGAELLKAVESLYEDQLQPYGRIVKKRLDELAEAAGRDPPGIDLSGLRVMCESMLELRVESPGGPDWSALLQNTPGCFVDIYSPDDPFPEETWETAATYFQGLCREDMGVPGGRYVFAQRLIKLDVPFLRGFTLGKVCHFVQLAMTRRKLLGYCSGGVVPYGQSWTKVKETCAEQQRLCRQAKMKIATWDDLLKHVRVLLEDVRYTGGLPLSCAKRLFRCRFQLDLCETALGRASAKDLFLDERLAELCTMKLQKNGYYVYPTFPPPTTLPNSDVPALPNSARFNDEKSSSGSWREEENRKAPYSARCAFATTHATMPLLPLHEMCRSPLTTPRQQYGDASYRSPRSEANGVPANRSSRAPGSQANGNTSKRTGRAPGSQVSSTTPRQQFGDNSHRSPRVRGIEGNTQVSTPRRPRVPEPVGRGYQGEKGEAGTAPAPAPARAGHPVVPRLRFGSGCGSEAKAPSTTPARPTPAVVPRLRIGDVRTSPATAPRPASDNFIRAPGCFEEKPLLTYQGGGTPAASPRIPFDAYHRGIGPSCLEGTGIMTPRQGQPFRGYPPQCGEVGVAPGAPRAPLYDSGLRIPGWLEGAMSPAPSPRTQLPDPSQRSLGTGFVQGNMGMCNTPRAPTIPEVMMAVTGENQFGMCSLTPRAPTMQEAFTSFSAGCAEGNNIGVGTPRQVPAFPSFGVSCSEGNMPPSSPPRIPIDLFQSMPSVSEEHASAQAQAAPAPAPVLPIAPPYPSGLPCPSFSTTRPSTDIRLFLATTPLQDESSVKAPESAKEVPELPRIGCPDAGSTTSASTSHFTSGCSDAESTITVAEHTSGECATTSSRRWSRSSSPVGDAGHAPATSSTAASSSEAAAGSASPGKLLGRASFVVRNTFIEIAESSSKAPPIGTTGRPKRSASVPLSSRAHEEEE
eukprot:TRINITY_DN40081_c0_g1_i1.p1 TRINITY_DN40081_c0_g1~~TRINITY_DN40081_c0_g1_i1.p1  ORF type:complete len:961 (-),score=149.03 TRINITY_DN40081_c0_g1_i1:385-3267(-)